VERVFPVHAPRVEKVVVNRSGRKRRAKLYYLRDRVGKATRLREDTRGSDYGEDDSVPAEAAAADHDASAGASDGTSSE